MPAWLLIGIPIAVAVLMWGILSLPDEEVEEETPSDSSKPASKKKKKKS